MGLGLRSKWRIQISPVPMTHCLSLTLPNPSKHNPTLRTLLDTSCSPVLDFRYPENKRGDVSHQGPLGKSLECSFWASKAFCSFLHWPLGTLMIRGNHFEMFPIVAQLDPDLREQNLATASYKAPLGQRTRTLIYKYSATGQLVLRLDALPSSVASFLTQ